MKGGCCNVREVNILYLTGIETQHNNIYKTKRRNSDLRKDIIVTNVGESRGWGDSPPGKMICVEGGCSLGVVGGWLLKVLRGLNQQLTLGRSMGNSEKNVVVIFQNCDLTYLIRAEILYPRINYLALDFFTSQIHQFCKYNYFL